jgi:hypothetical protein
MASARRETRSVTLESPRWHWKQTSRRSAAGSRSGFTIVASGPPVGLAPSFLHLATWTLPGPWQRSQSIPWGNGAEEVRRVPHPLHPRVVAEDAAGGDLPPEVLVAAVEAGAEIPQLPRGVPADGRLEELPLALDHVGAAVVVAPHHPDQLVLLRESLLPFLREQELAHVEAVGRAPSCGSGPRIREARSRCGRVKSSTAFFGVRRYQDWPMPVLAKVCAISAWQRAHSPGPT